MVNILAMVHVRYYTPLPSAIFTVSSQQILLVTLSIRTAYNLSIFYSCHCASNTVLNKGLSRSKLDDYDSLLQ